jgi:hypothetical protein
MEQRIKQNEFVQRQQDLQYQQQALMAGMQGLSLGGGDVIDHGMHISGTYPTGQLPDQFFQQQFQHQHGLIQSPQFQSPQFQQASGQFQQSPQFQQQHGLIPQFQQHELIQQQHELIQQHYAPQANQQRKQALQGGESLYSYHEPQITSPNHNNHQRSHVTHNHPTNLRGGNGQNYLARNYPVQFGNTNKGGNQKLNQSSVEAKIARAAQHQSPTVNNIPPEVDQFPIQPQKVTQKKTDQRIAQKKPYYAHNSKMNKDLQKITALMAQTNNQNHKNNQNNTQNSNSARNNDDRLRFLERQRNQQRNQGNQRNAGNQRQNHRQSPTSQTLNSATAQSSPQATTLTHRGPNLSGSGVVTGRDVTESGTDAFEMNLRGVGAELDVVQIHPGGGGRQPGRQPGKSDISQDGSGDPFRNTGNFPKVSGPGNLILNQQSPTNDRSGQDERGGVTFAGGGPVGAATGGAVEGKDKGVGNQRNGGMSLLSQNKQLSGTGYVHQRGD